MVRFSRAAACAFLMLRREAASCFSVAMSGRPLALLLAGELLQLFLAHAGLRLLACALAGQLGAHELALLLTLRWHRGLPAIEAIGDPGKTRPVGLACA